MSHLVRNMKYRFFHDRALIMTACHIVQFKLPTEYSCASEEKMMVYHNVNKKNTFNYGLIYYIGNYTQFSIQRLNSESMS